MRNPILPRGIRRIRPIGATCAAICTLCLLASCASTPDAGGAGSAPGAVYASETLAPGRYALVVLGMSCPKCISNVDLQLARIEGIRDAKVDMRHGLVTFVVPGPAEPSRAAVSRAILDAGFTLREIRRVEAEGGAS
ncbi:MAG: Heavy-metal-associated domain [Planctomycetota bacterium]